MNTSISIIICCYNSVLRLPETLKYLVNQQVASLDWEVIVVDNNSSDNTREVADREWDKLGSPVPLVVISEPTPGLSYARAAGVKQARYELLLLCDDDNWLEPDYLERASQLMLADPQIGILGGLNTAISTVELPDWFTTFEEAYACGPQAESDGEVAANRLYITGAGMVVRRGVLNDMAQIGFKSNLTERKGEELSSGGDTEMCFVSAMLGYKLVYSSQLRLFHFMESKRLSWSYLIKLTKGHAKSYHKLGYYKRIYQGELVSTKWADEDAAWRKILLSREGVLMLYHVYLKGERAIGDKFNITILSKWETWKAHRAISLEYKKFINELYYLKEVTKEIASQRRAS